jgi:hypothetical protein
MAPSTPARPRLAGGSQRGTTIPVAIRTPERLRPWPNLAPRVSPIAIPSPEELAWRLPTSTAPPSFGQTGACRKRERESIIRYKQDREDGYRTTSVGVSQHQVYMYIDALCRSPNAERYLRLQITPFEFTRPGHPAQLRFPFSIAEDIFITRRLF